MNPFYFYRMKYILQILLVVFFVLVGYGFYLNAEIAKSGDKWIGFGVLLIAFVIMPLFIYHRYRKKNVKDYLLKNFTDENSEKTENQ